MSETVDVIPLTSLLVLLVPVTMVLIILHRWSLNAGKAIYSISRMLGQLLIIGYFLTFIFDSESAFLVVAVLSIMAFSSSWIALGSLDIDRRILLQPALVSIALVGAFLLLIVTQGVLQLEPWYMPQFMIPLAGMVFANSMNCVSLGAERLMAELARQETYDKARHTAMQAAMIPIINSMFAVGLVSLPGMMTGQILSGISPLIAARYQIMVMCMIFSCAGLSTACFLVLARTKFVANSHHNSQM